jgi:hypothetical protein
MKAHDGLIIRYDFLWKREADRGEETGRKACPVCVQLLMDRSGRAAEPVILLPLTTKEPYGDTIGIEVPELEARRAGLSARAWVVINSFNYDADLASSPHVAAARPLGSFSPTFAMTIRRALKRAIADRKAVFVQRAK